MQLEFLIKIHYQSKTFPINLKIKKLVNYKIKIYLKCFKFTNFTAN